MGKIVDAAGHPFEEARKEREIPEDLLKSIKEGEDKRNGIFNEFLNVSLKKAALSKREQELLEKITNNAQSLKNRIENAYKKMKLNRDSEYTWAYDGNDKFIGVPTPTPKIKNKK